jgi:hypothetical protein
VAATRVVAAVKTMVVAGVVALAGADNRITFKSVNGRRQSARFFA